MRPHALALLATFFVQSFAGAEELTGVRAAATNECPTPEEARARMTVPDGYEVRCFAHEPMVVNPVAMTWDARGRLWVVEAYEYPSGTALPVDERPFGGNAKDDHYHPMPALDALHPKDRVVILEDTDNNGIADKRTVFVEGLNLASAIICGDDGIYVGQQPHLLHFKDNNHDDKPDEWRVVLTGFGREDTHELVNSFCWGPDGWLYMTHGVFTNSRVRRPGEPEDKGCKFDAGIGRARPAANAKDPAWEFEVFADGTSNPWGCDYDERGNFFVSACVIDHLFHMAPGGIYARQGGAPENPYAYELLPSIVTHQHFRAAYAGIQIYQGGVYPKDTWGHAFIGNIHDNAIHEEVLTPVGATFKCEPRRDFLRANDGWFRPVSTRTGPDGNLWIMDWCDRYPCYQNAKANPEGVDRERGRIWRVLAKQESGSRPTNDMDLAKLETPALVKLLGNSNNWMRRWAGRELVERKDARARPLIESLARSDQPSLRLESLWTLHQAGMLSSRVLDASVADDDAGVRAWVARLSGERFRMADKHLADVADDDFLHSSDREGEAAKLLWPETERFEKLIADPDMMVRCSVAVAFRMASSGALTANRGLPHEAKCFRPSVRTFLMMNDFMKSCANNFDTLLQFEIWMSVETGLIDDPELALVDGQLSVATECEPLSRVLTYKAMRRLCDTRSPANLNLAIDLLTKIKARDILLAHALAGLEKGQESGIIKPTKDFSALFAEFAESENADVRKHAQYLATLWGDARAIAAIVGILADEKAGEPKRIEALSALRKLKNEMAKVGYAKLWLSKPPDGRLLTESLRAAPDLGSDDTAKQIVALWPSLNPTERVAATDALMARKAWAGALLDAVAAGQIPLATLPPTTARNFATSTDPVLKKRAEELLGVWRESNAETKALIAAKKNACLQGEPNFANGKAVFHTTCIVCHAFHGGGQKVGPELIGSGRSNLDALLANVIDPNQIIGNGYENTIVTTKDGRTLAGRVTEDAPGQVKLLMIGGQEIVISRAEVTSLVNTHQSLMPTGFGGLPDDTFRDLIWYVLAPPEEGPLTAEKKKLLSANFDAAAAVPRPPSVDWESVSLWNPEWKVIAPEFERTPVKLPEFHGGKNVLLLHPFPDRHSPAALERKVKVDASHAKLKVRVAADDRGDWQLQVKVDGRELRRLDVTHDEPRWKDVMMDLSPFAGKEVTIRLEAHATGWSFEFAYWADLRLEPR